jgi:hypothetical protein
MALPLNFHSQKKFEFSYHRPMLAMMMQSKIVKNPISSFSAGLASRELIRKNQ